MDAWTLAPGPFSVKRPRAGTGTPAPADQQASLPAGPDSDSGIPAWVWIVGAGVLLAAGLVLALRIGGKSPE